MKLMLDRLLVKVNEAKEQTATGLYLGQGLPLTHHEAVVLEVGNGRKTEEGSIIPLIISQGDTVIFPLYAGQKVTIKEEQFVILREDEVLGIIEK